MDMVSKTANLSNLTYSRALSPLLSPSDVTLEQVDGGHYTQGGFPSGFIGASTNGERTQ